MKIPRTIRDIDTKGKTVLVRVDFNVPLDDKLQITDDTRIRETLPTINYLRKRGAKIILISHLGRPKGKPNEKYSLKPVSRRLSELLNIPVKWSPDCIGTDTKKTASGLKSGEVLLLENLRFHGEEEKNDQGFAKELGNLGEIFVQDAFGTVHRAHASTEGVAKHLDSVCGLLLKKEITYFSKALENPEKPFLAILGGAKVSDKIMALENLLTKVEAMIIGGAMAYTFLNAKGISTGNSLVEKDKIQVAKEIIDKALKQEKKVSLLLPIDHIIADKISPDAQTKETSGVEIPSEWFGMDIGPMTISRIAPVILNSKTIVWNGPMGVFEIDKFSKGTNQVAKLVAQATEKGTCSIIGGGDTVSAIKKYGLSEKISHISTGGGASLELLEGKTLPGIAALGNPAKRDV